MILNKSQTEYSNEIKKFMEENLDIFERRKEFNSQAWALCAKFGLFSAILPERYGGQDMSLSTYITGLETFGYYCKDNGLIISIGAHVFACMLTILQYGTEEEKEKWLPLLGKGECIASIAIAEKQGASDAFNIDTIAEVCEEGYLITGEKKYITNIPYSDLILVFARDKFLKNEIYCFLVEKSNPGVECKQICNKVGLNSSPLGIIKFDNCYVEKNSKLGKNISAKLIFMSAMEWERGCILAPVVGAMERQVLEVIQYLKKRENSEMNLAHLQVLKHRVADMKVNLELSKLVLYNFANAKEINGRAGIEASMAKLFISEAFQKNSYLTMQMHGAAGFTGLNDIGSDFMDSLGFSIASGTSDIQREIIAHWLKMR